MQGWRLLMEDSHIVDSLDNSALLCVFDGHGGDQVSTYCSDRMKSMLESNMKKYSTLSECLIETYKQLDASLISKEGMEALANIRKPEHYDNLMTLNGYCNTAEFVGSTGLTTIVHENNLTVANLGDCRCILVKGDEIIQLTTDHRASCRSEVKRIKECGGSIVNGRVNQKLSVTRSFGDFEFKTNKDVNKQIVSCIPEITEYKLDGTEDLLIMGCDGIFDVLSNEELVNSLRKGINEKSLAEVCQDVLTSCLANDPYEQEGNDNMTLIVSVFDKADEKWTKSVAGGNIRS